MVFPIFVAQHRLLHNQKTRFCPSNLLNREIDDAFSKLSIFIWK